MDEIKDTDHKHTPQLFVPGPHGFLTIVSDTSSGLCQTLISAGAGFGECPKPVWKSLFQAYVCAEYINPAKILHLLELF